jgi:hypothetical protein
MKIYITCPVRNATDKQRRYMESYTKWLEEKGHEVHLPHRDTDQEDSALEICMTNGAAIAMADEIHVFYDPASTGSHFDLGMIFALDQLEGRKKRIRVIQTDSGNKEGGKDGFIALLDQWMHLQNEHNTLYRFPAEAAELDFSIPFWT